MKKTVKIFVLTIMIVFILLFLNYNVNASFDISSAVGGYGTSKGSGLVKATELSMGTVIKAIGVVAVGSAVLILIYLAIKYMTSAPSGRADVAKTAVPYIIGVVVLFGASGIINLISGWVSN